MKNYKLSQMGLVNIPQTPKQFMRPEKRTVLDKFNNKQEDCFLHPTKGFRVFSARRSRAAMITAEIKRGMFPFNTQKIREALK